MKNAPFSASGATCRCLTGTGYGPELDHDLTGPRRMNEPIGTLHDFFERVVGRQARKNNIRLRADLGGRTHGHAADLFKLIERAAAIADDSITVFDQVHRDRHADLADAHNANGLHFPITPSRGLSD